MIFVFKFCVDQNSMHFYFFGSSQPDILPLAARSLFIWLVESNRIRAPHYNCSQSALEHGPWGVAVPLPPAWNTHIISHTHEQPLVVVCSSWALMGEKTCHLTIPQNIKQVRNAWIHTHIRTHVLHFLCSCKCKCRCFLNTTHQTIYQAPWNCNFLLRMHESR